MYFFHSGMCIFVEVLVAVFAKSLFRSDPKVQSCLIFPPYEYSSQLLSPMGGVRRRRTIAVVRIITTKVEWIGIEIEVRVWVIIWFRIELLL